MKNIISAWVLLALFITTMECSHFRGALIHWRPANPEHFDGQMVITHRTIWRPESLTSTQCNSMQDHFSGESGIRCREGCDTNFGDFGIFCTDFNYEDDVITGERSNIVNFTNVKYFEAGSLSGNWISSLSIGSDGDWAVIVKGNLTVRPDGKVNSSPVTAITPVVHLNLDCVHEFSIPVKDIDGDIVHCRWAEVALDECGGVCDSFPNAMLDMDNCTISYSGPVGLYAVAIQIEDFLTPASTTPLSSVPLQFTVNAFNSTQPCSAQPELVGETPEDGSCIPVEIGSTYTAGIVARSSGGSSITDFVTMSPLGLVQSSVTQSAHYSDHYFINITYTPTQDQLNQINIFCFSARNDRRLTSKISCISFSEFISSQRSRQVEFITQLMTRSYVNCFKLLGVNSTWMDFSLAVAEDKFYFLLVMIMKTQFQPTSVSPTGMLSPSSSITWNITFDQPIRKPSGNHFIKIYQEGINSLIYATASRSPNVTFSNQAGKGKISFTIDFNFNPGRTYYFLVERGAALGLLCGHESDSITWTFTIISEASSTSFAVLASVITAILTALLMAVAFTIVQIAICKCSRNKTGQANKSTAAKLSTTQEVDVVYDEVVRGNTSYTEAPQRKEAGFALEENKAYAKSYI